MAIWMYTSREQNEVFFGNVSIVRINCKIAMMGIATACEFSTLNTSNKILQFLHQIIIRYSIIYIEGNYTNLNC